MINCYKLLVSDLLKVVDNARMESLRHCFTVRISHYILIAAVEEVLRKVKVVHRGNYKQGCRDFVRRTHLARYRLAIFVEFTCT